jgi:hypothetical protein
VVLVLVLIASWTNNLYDSVVRIVYDMGVSTSLLASSSVSEYKILLADQGMGERRGAYRALVGKPEGRRPLGRPRRRWEDNIKMDL